MFKDLYMTDVKQVKDWLDTVNKIRKSDNKGYEDVFLFSLESSLKIRYERVSKIKLLEEYFYYLRGHQILRDDRKAFDEIFSFLTEVFYDFKSDKEYLDFVVDQIENACQITYKKMFGEYGIYSDGKLFALVCDNKLFIKPTEAGRSFIQDVVEAPPYPGAKLSFLIEDKLEDREWISNLVKITVNELPEPKPKKKKNKGESK